MALNLEFKLGPDSKSPTLCCNLSRLVLLDVELRSMLRGSLDGRGVWGWTDTWICMAGSRCCSLKLTQHCNLAIHQYKIKRFLKTCFEKTVAWLSLDLGAFQCLQVSPSTNAVLWCSKITASTVSPKYTPDPCREHGKACFGGQRCYTTGPTQSEW